MAATYILGKQRALRQRDAQTLFTAAQVSHSHHTRRCDLDRRHGIQVHAARARRMGHAPPGLGGALEGRTPGFLALAAALGVAGDAGVACRAARLSVRQLEVADVGVSLGARCLATARVVPLPADREVRC